MKINVDTTVAGIEFANPICVAGGMDKDGTRTEYFDALGCGAIEVGSITLRKRVPGKVNLNLLFSDRAIINNMGASSVGAARVRMNLRNAQELESKLGINLIPNLDANEYDDIFTDLFRMIHLFRKAADFYVVNVSSPNMADLRELQNYNSFAAGFGLIRDAMTEANIETPIFLKFASDASESQIFDAVRGFEEGLYDGVIIGNSSLWRPERIKEKYKNVGGGLSGSPIATQSNTAIAKAYTLSNGTMPIIGCGGILDGHSAYEAIVHGASLIQIHSAFRVLPIAHKDNAIKFVANMNWQLSKYLQRDGFKSIAEAVGATTQYGSTKT